MAYYFKNNCEFNKCGMSFPSLNDLIEHIEATHIDFSESVIEESERLKVPFLPMSYILRYNRNENKVVKEEAGDEVPGAGEEVKIENISEVKEESYASQDFLSTQWSDEVSTSGKNSEKGKLKRFCCPINGCTKRYKNQNGMKYHMMNYHDYNGNSIKPKKEYKCQCGKEYKTIRGLQSHALSHKESLSPRVVPKLDRYKIPKSTYHHHHQHHAALAARVAGIRGHPLSSFYGREFYRRYENEAAAIGLHLPNPSPIPHSEYFTPNPHREYIHPPMISSNLPMNPSMEEPQI